MRYELSFNVAGVTFENRQGLLYYIAKANDVKITLWRDKENKNDSNAIKVMVKADGKKFPIGFVPKKLAKTLAPIIDEKRAFIFVNRFHITGYSGGLRGMTLDISWTEKE